jgi:Aspartyl/Asparaginyl beta-hydroxylase
MQNSFRLPFNFDSQPLRADLNNLQPGDWIPHFNTRYYEGEWSAVALRSVGGVAGQIYPDPTAQGSFADTPLLARCPNIRTALARFECPLESVRLLKLDAGSSIREHKDLNLGYEDGEIRIHVPVLTNPGVEFFLDGERILMNEGESWYINFNLRHRVENRGSTPRIHLVVDCIVNDWMRAQLAAPAALLDSSEK